MPNTVKYDQPVWYIIAQSYIGFFAFLIQVVGLWIFLSFFHVNLKHGGFETGYRSVFISALANGIIGIMSSFFFGIVTSNAITGFHITNSVCDVVHRIAIYSWITSRYCIYLFLIFRMEVAFRNTHIVPVNLKLWVTIATIGYICFLLVVVVFIRNVVAAKHPRSGLIVCDSLVSDDEVAFLSPILVFIDFFISIGFVVYFSWALYKLNKVMKSLEEPSVGPHNSKDLVRARTASGGETSSPNSASQQSPENEESFLLRLAHRSLVFGLIAIGSTLTIFMAGLVIEITRFLPIDTVINFYCILGAYGIPIAWLKKPEFWLCGELDNKSQDRSSGNSNEKKSEEAVQLEAIISTSSAN